MRIILFFAMMLGLPISSLANQIHDIDHCFRVTEYAKDINENFGPESIVSFELCISGVSGINSIKDQNFYQKGESLPINAIIRYSNNYSINKYLNNSILNLYIRKSNVRDCNVSKPIELVWRERKNHSGHGCVVVDFGHKKFPLEVYAIYSLKSSPQKNDLPKIPRIMITAKYYKCDNGKSVCKSGVYDSTEAHLRIKRNEQ